ncbi:MMPL family transporter [Aurantivibrio plasticivorans]
MRFEYFNWLLSVLTHRRAAQLWFLCVVLSLLSILLTLPYKTFDTSIMALLPEEQSTQRESVRLAKRQLTDSASTRMLFLVVDNDRENSITAAENFTRALRRSELFNNIVAEQTVDNAVQWQRFYHDYRYGLLTPEAQALLREEDASALVSRAVARLYSPMAASVAPDIQLDPLQLFFDWQMYAPPKTPLSINDNWLTRKTKQDGKEIYYRMVSAELTQSPFDMSYQQAVFMAIQRGKDNLPPSSDVITSGILKHAAYGAELAKREVSTIGLGSLAGVTLLLLYVFRRVRYLLLAFLPIVVGCTFAFAVTNAVFAQLHIITLAFGASLVGVAIDYSLHFLCAQREPSNHYCGSFRASARRTLVLIFPGLFLGLVSSILAYAAQGIAPFPGLRQMALFSVCGLLGAWLTVVSWFPWLPFREVKQSENREMPAFIIQGVTRLLLRWPTIDVWPVRAGLLAVFFLAVLGVSQIDVDDGILRLQTSPVELLEEDRKIQQLTGDISGSQFFVISGNNAEQVLQHAEAFMPSLQELVGIGALYDFQSIARVLPSLQSQQQNIVLQSEKVYINDGLLFDFLDAIGTPQLLDDFNRTFAGARQQPLTFEDWYQHAVSEPLRPLWLGEIDGISHMIVTLAGIEGRDTVASLATLAEQYAHVEFVDNVAALEAVLTYHRQQFQLWLFAAYGIVFLILTWRYTRQAWRIVAAPGLASLITLAVFGALGIPLNIFNLLALLLVLGIGLDASIFLRESRRSPHTWVAVTLSSLTTVMAFGFLALSETPVLHQFGITVLVSLAGIWVLTPCFVDKPEQELANT